MSSPKVPPLFQVTCWSHLFITITDVKEQDWNTLEGDLIEVQGAICMGSNLEGVKGQKNNIPLKINPKYGTP